jgi:tyrosine-specific transport protein
MPPNSNLITMARSTLGPVGSGIAWLTFLLLLYSLLCAYISGGSGLLQHLLQTAGLDVSDSVASIVFTLVFGMVVYLGIHITDYVNRGLMSVKLIGYVLLVVCLMPFVSTENLAVSNIAALKTSGALVVTIASFGFATIVPSLRIYLGGDVKKLRRVILVGSLIPLVCYVIWDMVIMGVIPLQGSSGLAEILHSDNSTSMLVENLSATAANGAVTFFTKLFTSVCVLTSFLGVSLCLTDFLADGFGMEKVGINRLIIQLATYLPPLIIVLFYPNAFIQALEYAGAYCVVLLILLPAWMAMRGRRRFQSTQFRVPGGNVFLAGLIAFAFAAIVYSLVC